MVFIDGTWLYYSLFERGRRCQIARTYGEGWHETHHIDSPSKSLERKRLYKRIMDAMEELSEDQKQVVLLREMEGLSYKEIAVVMDIPEGTVMSRLYYARKRLQKLLESERPKS